MSLESEDFSLLLELAAELSRSGRADCSLALMRLLAVAQKPIEIPRKGKPYLTTGEAAQLLGVSSQTVANWCESGKLAALRTVGGDRRIPAAALNDALKRTPKGADGTWKPLCAGCHHALKTTGQCRAATMYVTRINDPDFPFLPGDEDNCRAAALVRQFGGKTRVFEHRILQDGSYKGILAAEASRADFLFSPCELPGYGHDPRTKARQFGIKFRHCFAYNELEEGCSAMHSGKAKDVQKALKTCPAYCFLQNEGFRSTFDEYGKLWVQGKLIVS